MIPTPLIGAALGGVGLALGAKGIALSLLGKTEKKLVLINTRCLKNSSRKFF